MPFLLVYAVAAIGAPGVYIVLRRQVMWASILMIHRLVLGNHIERVRGHLRWIEVGGLSVAVHLHGCLVDGDLHVCWCGWWRRRGLRIHRVRLFFISVLHVHCGRERRGRGGCLGELVYQVANVLVPLCLLIRSFVLFYFIQAYFSLFFSFPLAVVKLPSIGHGVYVYTYTYIYIYCFT